MLPQPEAEDADEEPLRVAASIGRTTTMRTAPLLALACCASAAHVSFSGSFPADGGAASIAGEALGRWAATLGAPLSADAGLPATDLLSPPSRLAVVVAPVAAGAAGAGGAGARRLAPGGDVAAAVGAGLRSADAAGGRVAGVVCAAGAKAGAAGALCDRWLQPVDGKRALRRLAAAGHPLEAAVAAAGGAVVREGGPARVRGSAMGAWLDAETHGAFLGEAAGLAEVAAGPHGDAERPRVDVLVASRLAALAPGDAAAGLAILEAVARHGARPAAFVDFEDADDARRLAAASCGRDDFREIWGGKTMRNRHRHAW